MENGTMKMCTPVFGYELVDGELILNPDKAEIIKQIFDWYLNGFGTAAIAKILNTKHQKCSKARKTLSLDSCNDKANADKREICRRSAVSEILHNGYSAVQTDSK